MHVLVDAKGATMESFINALARDAEAGHGGSDGWRLRRYDRCSMFKPAHVVTDDAVHDCVLLDLSPGGAQIYLIAHAELPDQVTLLLPNGESRRMRCRWQRGWHIGYEATGDAVPPS